MDETSDIYQVVMDLLLSLLHRGDTRDEHSLVFTNTRLEVTQIDVLDGLEGPIHIVRVQEDRSLKRGGMKYLKTAIHYLLELFFVLYCLLE